MLAKKLTTRIGKNKTLVLHVPDIPQGEVEVIILKKDEPVIEIDNILKQIPKRRLGKILSTLRREEYAHERVHHITLSAIHADDKARP